MIVVLLVWLLLAPLAAWTIGAGVRLAEQRRPVVVDDSDEGPCQPAEDDVRELAAAG
jgi:hypothetical protein